MTCLQLNEFNTLNSILNLYASDGKFLILLYHRTSTMFEYSNSNSIEAISKYSKMTSNRKQNM